MVGELLTCIPPSFETSLVSLDNKVTVSSIDNQLKQFKVPSCDQTTVNQDKISTFQDETTVNSEFVAIAPGSITLSSCSVLSNRFRLDFIEVCDGGSNTLIRSSDSHNSHTTGSPRVQLHHLLSHTSEGEPRLRTVLHTTTL